MYAYGGSYKARTKLGRADAAPSMVVIDTYQAHAAGEKLGASPVERSAVNVGTVLGPPYPPATQAEVGQARRQPTAPGRGGALVVVRAWESHVHGEGGQRARKDKPRFM